MPKMIAALAVAIAVAGCGSGGTTTTTAATATPAPAAASTVAAGEFDPSLVSTTKTPASSTSAKKRASPRSPRGTTTTASNAAQALALSSGATPTASTQARTTASPPPATANPSKSTTNTVAKASKPKIKIVTVTKYATHYLTKTVTVAPKVPVGAFLPSTHPAMSSTSFKVASSNVGCAIGGGSVRCDVAHQSWAAPTQPASCTQSWGTGIVLIDSSAAHRPRFACGGASALRAGATVVHNGYDDTVGGITCQVRGFGVDCFATDKHGFILSPTGYILY